ncbi:hypothetical protein CHS0354_029797 [Potamilus streckersoni]|uniref:Cytoplasmic tRNA 2-thiolation protein 2 n=1 Tax=Potamilus streckersoni TaxID=2493646 RepID=A0AAE0TH66_9BIVA|nr:hypothetical protein CHS0354_029797 [Potamilus streckersoni]
MCSVEEGDTDVPFSKSRPNESIGRTCMKCQEKAILITRVNDAFCRSCFMVYITHKFRATVGKTKLVRDGEMVLVALSGGPSSSALLHLIQEGLSERTHKKLRFRPGLIFIDEGAAVNLPSSERLNTCEKMLEIMKSTGFPCHIKALEQGLDNDNIQEFSSPPDICCPGSRLEKELGTIDYDTESILSDISTATSSVTLDMSECSISSSIEEPYGNSREAIAVSSMSRVESSFQKYEEAEEKLKCLLKSLNSVSSQEDLIRTIRHKILSEVATTCGYSKVMLGSCGTRLAVTLLTDMAIGRGGQAAVDTVFADRRYKNVMFLRPLREFSSKEIGMYNALNDVESVFIPTLTTKGSDGASIEHLTEAFVTGLQRDYPSTVSNIMRTGEKLSTGAEEENKENCAMCQSSLDTNVIAPSALNAVEFSQRISSRGDNSDSKRDHCNKTGECCGEGDGSCNSTRTRATKQQVLASLCYGCRLAIRKLDDVEKLPLYVLKDVFWRVRREKMKSEIEEFLLDTS